MVAWGLLAGAAAVLASGEDAQPNIDIGPEPICAGDPLLIEVTGMPDQGKWSVLVTYSNGAAETPHDVTDSSNTVTGSTPPPGAAGGTMTVTVNMDGNSTSVSKPVRACP